MLVCMQSIHLLLLLQVVGRKHLRRRVKRRFVLILIGVESTVIPDLSHVDRLVDVI